MRHLRINGIVSIANRIRHGLGAAGSAADREQAARQARNALTQIDALLGQHQATARQLPPPSRRAYAWLRQVCLNPTQVAPFPERGALQAQPEQGSISFPGLRTFLTGLLDDIALGLAQNRLKPAATLQVIRGTAERLNHLMERRRFQPGQLKPEARQLLGWFRYFAREEDFAEYLAGLERASRSLLPALHTRPRWQPPFTVHYRPSQLLYCIRCQPHLTRVILDTPMLAFDEVACQLLARRMLNQERHQEAMMAAMMSAPYQRVRTRLEAMAAAADQTQGSFYDLAEVFDRVNHAYFQGQMARPRLAWSRTLTGRKFGHYDYVHDQICISSTLDTAAVPAFVIEHVMHHELLHKKLGFHFRGERQHSHTREFRAEERRFERYAEADAFLKKIGRTVG